jgi:predicted phosphate transport protein (TIGR00153 family)
MSRPLENWLTARRKMKVFELIREHADKALQVTDELVNMTDAALAGDHDRKEAAFERGRLREREGDVLRRKTEEELAKGELAPEERGYLMRLARQIDGVADYAHGASRVLTFVPADKFDETMKDEVRTMSAKTRECVASLDACVHKFTDGDIAGAIKAADLVEELEEQCDELHMSSRKTLMSAFYSSADPRTVVFSSELMEAIEETSDRCEDVSDQIRVLIVYISQPTG